MINLEEFEKWAQTAEHEDCPRFDIATSVAIAKLLRTQGATQIAYQAWVASRNPKRVPFPTASFTAAPMPKFRPSEDFNE